MWGWEDYGIPGFSGSDLFLLVHAVSELLESLPKEGNFDDLRFKLIDLRGKLIEIKDKDYAV